MSNLHIPLLKNVKKIMANNQVGFFLDIQVHSVNNYFHVIFFYSEKWKSKIFRQARIKKELYFRRKKYNSIIFMKKSISNI